MKKLKGYLKAREALDEDFFLSDFPKIKKIVLEPLELHGAASLVLRLTLDGKGKFEDSTIKLVFNGVCSLKIDGIYEGNLYASGLAVRDISDQQLENINLEIYDYENDCLQFYCETAEILDLIT